MKQILSTAILMIGTLVITSTFADQGVAVIDDFEQEHGFDDRWWSLLSGGRPSSFECTADAPGYNSEGAMRMVFDLVEEQWPGCGTDVDNPVEWVNSDGLSFAVRSDPPGITFEVVLAVYDPTQTFPDTVGYTPFDSSLAATGTWTTITLPWETFVKSEWVGETGINVIDLSQVTELMFIIDSEQQGTLWIDDVQLVTSLAGGFDKFALWTSCTQLRGIVIWQRVIVPSIDFGYLGSGYVGPPHIIQDFEEVAKMGANLIIISGPGLYKEKPPYVLDAGVQDNLDRLLALIAKADMFAVISFRTGPGRSDFTFYDEDIEEWGDSALVIDDIWTERAAQDAWVKMWNYAAERYRDNPVVIGYDILAEPNAADRMLQIWEGSDFYPTYENSTYDWNYFYPRIVDAIRQVDTDTPILVGPMGYSKVSWLPYLEPVDDPRTVYTVHQYEPKEYTHQPTEGTNTYPGSFDQSWDGRSVFWDRLWLDRYLSVIDDFQQRYRFPVAVTEYGVLRWAPNAADFMHDEMALFEQRGLNHAFWKWNALCAECQERHRDIDGFDILHGPNPNNHANVESSSLITVVLENWSQNTIRPSTAGE